MWFSPGRLLKPRLAIIIPAYNEERRLPRTLTRLREAAVREDFPWELVKVLVVNDGSRDGTSACVREEMPRFPALDMIEFRGNLGKGAAVYAGLFEMQTYFYDRAEWILVADADEATPWRELWGLAEARAQEPEAFLIFGSRRHPESRILTRQVWWREKMGRIFNQMLRLVTGVPFKDTQCGFKLFRAGENLNAILAHWTVERFAWDAEVVLNALGLGFRCVEHPIEWHHVDESRVHPVRDGLQMAQEILKIRLKRSINRWRTDRPQIGRFDQTPFADRVKTQVISSKTAPGGKNRTSQNS